MTAPIVILAEDTPGLSTTIMGQTGLTVLKNRGYDVSLSIVPGHNRPDVSSAGLSHIHKSHVICLQESKVPGIIGSLRYVHPKSVVSVFTGNFEDHMDIDAGYYLSCFAKSVPDVPVWHVPHSPWSKHKTETLAREWFTPSRAREIMSRTRMIPYGIEKGFAPGENKPEIMVAPFNRLTAQKNVKMHAEVLRKYQAKYGEKCLFLHAPNYAPEGHPHFDSSVYYAQRQSADREVFKDQMSAVGMFLSTSGFESFGIYYLELLASGAVGVFLRRKWVELLLPDYPLVAEYQDLPGMLSWARENHDEAKTLIASSVKKALELYSVERFYDEIIKLAGVDDV